MSQIDDGVVQFGIDMALFDRYATLIFAYLRRQVSSQQDAEDLMLEVFLAAFQYNQFSTLDTERQIAWLKRVARNKVVDRYRHNSLLTLLPLETVMETLKDEFMPEHQVLQKEAYQQLYQSLKQLSPIQQQVIQMRFGDCLPLIEIADILGKQAGTVRSILSRTLRHLRMIYEQQ
jgi:RNA polymerase sigma-70 factor (ECF subfamily)